MLPGEPLAPALWLHPLPRRGKLGNGRVEWSLKDDVRVLNLVDSKSTPDLWVADQVGLEIVRVFLRINASQDVMDDCAIFLVSPVP